MTDATALRDADARGRIASGFDRNMLVEAGAGSGKTHSLADRMAAGVAAGAYVIDRMAAVTFTRKAAAELRGRFQLALEERLRAATGVEADRGTDEGGPQKQARPATQEKALAPQEKAGPATPTEARLPEQPRGSTRSDQAARLEGALARIERFFAGTIHAFCAQLLRERPVEAGVAPGFTELDEVEELQRRRQSWRDYVTQAKSSGLPSMLALLDTGVTPRDLDKAFGMISMYEEVEFPADETRPPDIEAASRSLDQFWSALGAMLPPAMDPEATCKIQKRARQFIGQLRVADRARAAVLADLLKSWDGKPDVVKKCWPTAAQADRASALLLAFQAETVKPYLAAWRAHVYSLAVGVLMDARDFAAAERRRANTLSYNDLLLNAAAMLRTRNDVRQALQAKYHWLFVDEFQDTDPLQAEVMAWLAANPDAPAGTDADWTGVRLRSGALFVVGDPKQSIYRFRRADIDVYNQMRALVIASGGLVLTLTTCFRSLPVLCDWANGVFPTLFPASATSYAPAFTPLDAVRPPSPSAGPFEKLAGVGVLTVPPHVNRSDVVVFEAQRIARIIRGEVDAGRRGFGDFLVLTRKKKVLARYAQALEALDIPLEVSGAGAFAESPAVEALALLLRALSDPDDAVTLVGVLRGPFFGFSDPALFAYRQSGGSFNLLAVRGESPASTETGDAPGSQGATSEHIGPYVSEEQRREFLAGSPTRVSQRVGVQEGGSAGRMPAEFHHGLLTPIDAITDSPTVTPAKSGTSRAGQPQLDLFADTVPDAADDPAARQATDEIVAALQSLRDMYRWTRRLPVGAALDRILDATGFLALAASTPGGAEAGDLLHAIDRVRQVSSRGGTLADAADSLDEDIEAMTEVESVPLEPGRPDVVRVMNLHKVKGLEADVVFLADACGGTPSMPDIRVERRGPRSAGAFPIVRAPEDKPWMKTLLGQPLAWEQLAAEEKRYLDAEQDRLIYVAATRARDVLIVGRWTGKAVGQITRAWDKLDPFLRGAPEIPVPDVPEPALPAHADLSAAAREAADRRRHVRHAELREPTWSVQAVTDETHLTGRTPRIRAAADEGAALASDLDRSVLTSSSRIAADRDDPTAAMLQETPSHHADVGVAWGALIHGLLEHAMRRSAGRDAGPTDALAGRDAGPPDAARREDLRRLAQWLTVDTPDLRPAIDRAIDTVEAVMQADFWREARQSRACLVEVPFAITVGDRYNRSRGGREEIHNRSTGVHEELTASFSVDDRYNRSRGGREELADLFAPGAGLRAGRTSVQHGVIDLVYESAAGWRVLDYKTDRVATTDDLWRQYGAQVRAYASAWQTISLADSVTPGLFSVRLLALGWE